MTQGVIKVQEDVIEILKDATISGNELRLDAPLDRKQYAKVKKVLVGIGGPWNRSKKAHVFEEDVWGVLSDVLTTGHYFDSKKALEFFETPPDLVDDLLDAVGAGVGMDVLEPSCGKGAIVERLLKRKCKSVFAVEIDKDRAEYTREQYGGEPLTVIQDDFLDMKHSLPLFDAVVMNPPFSRGKDIEHFRAAFGFLRRNARIASVMSAGVVFKQDRKTLDFRRWLDDNHGEIRRLPEGTFKVSGTCVNTVMVTAR